MPIYDHTGAAIQMMGPGGERYAVYVMGPSGLITIDPGVTFTPPSGSYSSAGGNSAGYILQCSQSATWTWSVDNPANTSVTIPSGGSGTTIQFIVTSPRRTDGQTLTVTRVFRVTGTSGGTSATFTITITSQGSIRDQ